MESFFFGLQLHELIDVFKEQKVEFRQLLLLSEADLTHLGTEWGKLMTAGRGRGKGRCGHGKEQHLAGFRYRPLCKYHVFLGRGENG